MKHLKTYESYLLDHLKSRGLDLEKTHIIYDEQKGDAYFFIYNLTGQLIGYQKYNPNNPKVDDMGEDGRYFSHIRKELLGQGKVGVYGLETYQMDKKYLFIAEGIFDIIKIHNMGEPGIANLGCSLSKQAINWYRTLPQIKILIQDKDEAGKELTQIADYVLTVPDPYKDLGDMPQNEVDVFINNIKNKLGI
jgi:hypothetical protein